MTIDNYYLIIQHAISETAHILPFDPLLTCQQTPMITTFQEVYFYTDSFEDAKEQMRWAIILYSHWLALIVMFISSFSF